MKLSNTFFVQSLLLCLILNLSFRTASAQGFEWAQVFVNSINNGGGVNVCATDENNNGYFAGSFSGTTYFDPSSGVMNVTASSDYDMFILKKDADGNLLWLKQIEGMDIDTGLCRATGIAVDDAGNIYIGGMYRDSFDFDPGPGVYLLSTYSYSYNGFVLKLSPSGDFLWAKSMGSQTTLSGFVIGALKVDAAANIFFTCGYSSNTPCTIDVDPGPGVYNIPCHNGDFLIEKLDSAGNFIWAKEISGTGPQGASALALDRMSNIYITGQQNGTADFDPGPGVANLSGSEDVFIAKYDSAGNYQWAGSLTGGWNDKGTGIATDTFGNVIVTGKFNLTCDFDPGPGVYNLTTGYSHTHFVLKLRSDGTFAWVKSFGFYSNGPVVATDGQGNIYTTVVSFVQKRDSTGNIEWSKMFDEGVYIAAITLDHSDDIYLVGRCAAFVDLDPGPGVFLYNNGFSSAGLIEKLCGASLDLAITANDDTLCPMGDNVQLSTPAVTGATYTWTRNGVLTTANSNSITVSEPGIYEVYVNGGCPSASAPVYIYDCNGNLVDPSGVGETMNNAGIEVYPNPFDDVLTVKGLQVNDVVSLTDVTGRVVRSWQGTQATETFMINDVAAGYYVLKVMNEKGVVRVNVPVVKR